MTRTTSFDADSQMQTRETVLFQKCPVCGQTKITLEGAGLFWLSKPKINPCPNCLAQFVPKGSDRFQLVYCEPQKLVERHICKDRIFRGCYLDATLSKEDWQKIAEGEELNAFSEFTDMTARFSRGLLPTYPSERLPFALVTGEIVHYVSCPVYVDDQEPSKTKASGGGTLFLTNKRIVLIHPSGTFIIQLEEIEDLEESPPGFFIKERGSFEPRFFFPPLYDPVFAVVKGAIRNLKMKS